MIIISSNVMLSPNRGGEATDFFPDHASNERKKRSQYSNNIRTLYTYHSFIKTQNLMPTYKEILIPELQYEVALTKKFIQRIPQDKMDWKAHEKSFTLRQLANHLADIPYWIPATMDMDEMEMSNYKGPDLAKTEEIIELLEKNAAAAEAALDKDDAEYAKPWTMKHQGQAIFTMPKYQTLRGMVLNQLPHHRAQLGVYLRMIGESVPATYGPSADEES